MSEQPDSMIIRLLQEMRVEAAARDEKTQAQIGTLAQGLTSVRNELQSLRIEVKDLGGHMREIAIAVDHHSNRLDVIESRLDRMEQHLGLDNPRH